MYVQLLCAWSLLGIGHHSITDRPVQLFHLFTQLILDPHSIILRILPIFPGSRFELHVENLEQNHAVEHVIGMCSLDETL